MAVGVIGQDPFENEALYLHQGPPGSDIVGIEEAFDPEWPLDCRVFAHQSGAQRRNGVFIGKAPAKIREWAGSMQVVEGMSAHQDLRNGTDDESNQAEALKLHRSYAIFQEKWVE